MTTPATVKAVEKTCVICEGAHPYYQCIATDSNISSACATTGTYNQGNTGFHPQVATNYRTNQNSPPGFPLVQNNQNCYNQNQNQSYNQNRGNNYQAPIQHPHVELPNEFSKCKQITETSIRAMQNQIYNFKAGLKNEIHSSMHNQINNDTASTSGSGSLPSNTVANPMGDLKAITTQSGVSYDGPPIPPHTSSFPKVVERLPDVTKDTPKPTIPYPSRVNKQKLREKDDNLALKFVEIFRNLHFELSFADALLYMPKSALMFKSLLNNKEKLFDLATTPVNENCSAVILKKLPEKLGDPVVDYVVDPRVFLILGRPFLRTRRALIDVYGEELTIRVDDEAITFNVGQTLKYSYNDAESINQIDVACEEYVQEGDILLLEELLNKDPSSSPLPPKELNVEEIKAVKSSIDEPSELELVELLSHLEYVFLEGTDKLPVIISKELKDEEKSALLK
nr:hypothetical protein [Tanacetum cinerariifolium]